jgi:hypothetical protein
VLARDRFYESPFRPKTYRVHFHSQVLDKFPPKTTVMKL